MRKELEMSRYAIGHDGFALLPIVPVIDEHTREEIQIMGDSVGTEIRLLQLEKAVTNNIFKGEFIVEFLLNSGYDTLEFEAIIAEMDLLLQEIQAVDLNSSEVVSLFVELKQDSIDLSKEFRDSLNGLLDNSTKLALQEALQDLVCETAQEIQGLIQNKILIFNGKKLENIFGFLGKENNQFLQGYKNGLVLLLQLKKQITVMAKNLTEEEKFELLTEIKGDRIKLQIRSRVCIENISNQYHYRKCIRLRNRLNNSEDIENEGVRLFMQQRLRLRINQSDESHPGYGGGQGSGSGNGQGSGGGNGHGDGGGQGSGSGNGQGSGGGNGYGNSSGNGSGNGYQNGNGSGKQ